MTGETEDTPVSHETLLAFLGGDLDDADRKRVLDAVEGSSELASRLRAAAAGLEGADAWGEAMRGEAMAEGSPRERVRTRRDRRVPAWWLPVAAAAAVLVAVPTTLSLAPDTSRPPPAVAGGQPESPEPTFVVVLHGRWPDAGTVGPAETRRRADEYWAWTTALADRGILVAAGDLRWEPGLRLASSDEPVEPPADVVADPDFLVGMFTVRADSYEEATAIARECPHLSYGGSVSVRRVGGGFVTVPGMGDWSE